MDNLTVRALSEEMAYIKGYTDALGEINGKRRRKQEQQKKKSEHRAKVAAGIMCGTSAGSLRRRRNEYYADIWGRTAGNIGLKRGLKNERLCIFLQ